MYSLNYRKTYGLTARRQNTHRLPAKRWSVREFGAPQDHRTDPRRQWIWRYSSRNFHNSRRKCRFAGRNRKHSSWLTIYWILQLIYICIIITKGSRKRKDSAPKGNMHWWYSRFATSHPGTTTWKASPHSQGTEGTRP